MRTTKFTLAISSNRIHDQAHYIALNRKSTRHWTLESEEWRICLMFDAQRGWHCRTIAQYIYGNGSARYRPTDQEVARVNRILRANNRSVRDFRNGKTPESRNLLNGVLRLASPVPHLQRRTA